MTSYERLHRAVLAGLVYEDPMGLAAPENDLTDEYDSEAREIARRLVHAGGVGDAGVVASAFVATFVESFGRPLPLRRIARAAAALALGEPGLRDLTARLGDAEVVAAFVGALIASYGRRAVVAIETDATGAVEVHVAAPPGEGGGTEPLTIHVLGPGDGELTVRGHLIELGAGDLGRHQPLRDPVGAIEELVVAVVTGSVDWTGAARRTYADDGSSTAIRERIRFVLPQGAFELETHFGAGGWGRTRPTSGQAVSYPRLDDVEAIDDDTDVTIDELWDRWLDFSGLVLRGGVVRIPVHDDLDGTASDERRRTLVIGPVSAVEMRDPYGHPWAQEFDGLWYEDPARVRIEGGFGVQVVFHGPGHIPRVTLESADPGGHAEREAVAVTLPDADGEPRTYADIDEARQAFCGDRPRVGTHRGHDEAGHRVTITVADVSPPWRRRRRLRRWLGPRLDVVSVVTEERSAAGGPSTGRSDDGTT